MLKPCSHCGGAADVTCDGPESAEYYYGECRKCHATGEMSESWHEAIVAWNRRVVTREQVEAAAEALRGQALGYDDREPLAEHSRAFFLKRAASVLRAAEFEVQS